MTPDRTASRDVLIAVSQAALGIVAGYVDTVAFFGLNGFFVTMVTGNVIVAGSNLLAFSGVRVLPNILSVPVYFFVVAALVAGRRLPGVSGLSAGAKIRSLLVLQALLLAVFLEIGAHISRRHGFPLTRPADIGLVGGIGVAAMSIQNAFGRLTNSTNPPTTIMTGNLTQVATALASLCTISRDADPAAWVSNVASLRSMLPALAGFFAGAVLAAPLVRCFGFDGLWPIIAFLIVVAPIVERADSREDGA